jgi:hypothetical protein
MNLMEKKVKVVSGKHEGTEGIVTGVTLDGYLFVVPRKNDFVFVKEKDVKIINQ